MRAIEEQDVVTAREQLIEPSTAATLHWILRVAVAGCFIGHGAFGIITKAAWVPYFAIFGIPAAWDSHQNTPSVSDYPSTQSTFSAAAAVTLASTLGGDQASFTVTSGKPFEGITRSFTSFSQAARESADSRVFAGIHFRSACEDGMSLGRKAVSYTHLTLPTIYSV